MYSILTTAYECYGKGKQLMKENLECVFSQTYRPIQCVVSDHSKNDKIENMIKTLDTRGVELVYVRYRENYGNPGENWNNALKYATGKYIQYNCMDERLSDPNAVEEIVKFMDNTHSKWIACGQITEPANTVFIPRWNPQIINTNTISGPTAVVIRDELKHIKMDPQFFNYIDSEWYYRLYKETGIPTIFNRVCYIGRIHDLQMTNIFCTQERIQNEQNRLFSKYGNVLPTS
jgi:glycosyltransferase involved in cell wall biosynthesis